MPHGTITEKTTALLPEIIKGAGIHNPILRVDETKTLLKFYLLGHREPLVIRKPKKAKAKQ